VSYDSEVLADSPVVYYKHAEASGTTMTDSSGNARHGTYGASAGLGSTRLGLDTTAIDTGAGGIGYRTADGALDFGGDVTIEAIVLIDTMGDYGTIFEKWPGDNTGGYSLHLKSDGGLRFTVRGSGGAIEYQTDPGDLVTGVIYHLAVTFNDTTNYVALYANGALLAEHFGAAAVLTADTATGLFATIGGRDNNNSGTVTLRFDGVIARTAIYNAALSAARIAAHHSALPAGPVWVSPANSAVMGATPVLVFTSPVAATPQHFWMELDTANTFGTGNLRTLRTDLSQTGWEYWNGSAWTAFPSTGLPAGSSGNNVRHTVQSALSAATWYRRVRAGV
jgi:hypothetical protein